MLRSFKRFESEPLDMMLLVEFWGGGASCIALYLLIRDLKSVLDPLGVLSFNGKI